MPRSAFPICEVAVAARLAMVRQTMDPDRRRLAVFSAVARAPLGWRPVANWFAGSERAYTTAIAQASRWLAFVGGQRRLDDDGDDWRSLLFGAPPALV